MTRMKRIGLVVLCMIHINLCKGSAPINPFEVDDLCKEISTYCDVETLRSLALLNKSSREAARSPLREIKEWRRKGGILITLFGAASEEDRNMYCRAFGELPGAVNDLTYEQMLEILLSYEVLEREEQIAAISQVIRDSFVVNTVMTDGDKRYLEGVLPDQDATELTWNFHSINGIDGKNYRVPEKLNGTLLRRILASRNLTAHSLKRITFNQTFYNLSWWSRERQQLCAEISGKMNTLLEGNPLTLRDHFDLYLAYIGMLDIKSASSLLYLMSTHPEVGFWQGVLLKCSSMWDYCIMYPLVQIVFGVNYVWQHNL